MSVTVKLYEYDETMDDDILASMGVNGGLIGQLTTDIPLNKRNKLRQNTPSHTVGSNNNPFPRRVLEEVTGIQTVKYLGGKPRGFTVLGRHRTRRRI